MKRKIILACVITCFLLSGCAKCISTETSVVEVTVKDEYYHSAYTTYVMCSKVLVPISHSAKYEITVEYCGNEYVITDEETYNKYKDKIGEVVKGTLETKIYDNGKTKNRIVCLGEVGGMND